MAWTQFMDMHSGGSQKEKFAYCYIEAPEDEAKSVFYSLFRHNPDRVTCTCCGNDYSISESESLEQATAYQRGCAYKDGVGYVEESDTRYSFGRKYRTLDEYKKDKSVRFIYAHEISDDMRHVDLPEEGYVWR